MARIDLHERPTGLSGPALDYNIEVTVAAGGQATIDGPQVNPGRTARLIGLIVSSSIILKTEVRTVEAGIASLTRITRFSLEHGWDWKSPDPNLITVAYTGLGLDAFRLILTNMDTGLAGDVYATIIYDEVP